MIRTLSRLGLTAVAIVAGGGGVVMAQTATTGTVAGTVTSAKGAPLADVKVTFSSSQVTRTVMSDASGHFRAGLLNAGTWKLTIEKRGFQTLNQTCTVATNSSTPLAIKLPEMAEAIVSVVASASQQISIDPTSTALGMSVTSEVFSKLPMGRNMNDLAYLAPSASFGGTMTEGQGLDYSLSGASGAENQFIIDGLITNDPRYGGQGTSLVTDFIESVSVEVGGFKPEFSALGGVFNAVVKSGSNEFKADAWTTFTPANSQAKAKSNAAGFRQLAPADRNDFGFDAGGALVKDSLFYYVGVDLDTLKRTPYPNNSGFQSPSQKTNTTQYVVKVNGYITPDQQVTASFINTDKKTDTPGAVPTGYGDANFGATRTYTTSNISLIYDWTIAPNVLLSVKAGTSHIDDKLQPNDTGRISVDDAYWYSGGGGGTVPALDGIDYYRGGYGSYANEKGSTTQFKADLSWILGDHSFKFGLSSMKATYFRQDWASGPTGQNLTWAIYADPSNTNTGITAYSTLYGNIGGAQVQSKFQGLYAQDTWEAVTGFRIFYGFRGESQEQDDPHGHAFLKFKMGDYIQPRFGFTWDVHNDGKTKLSGSYAWYYEQIPQRIGIREYASQKYLLTYYDLNTYSPTGLGTLGASQGTVDYGGFFDSPPVANNIKLPKREEITLGLEQALPNQMVFSFNGTYRKLTNPIEDSTLVPPGSVYGDPGYMNIANGALGMVWNPGSSVTWVAKQGTTDQFGQNIGGQTITVNNTGFPTAYNKYLAASIGLKRQTERTFWSATYTWSHLYGNYEGVIAPNYGGGGQPDGNITASWDFAPYLGTGNLALDRRHAFKFFGSHRHTFGAVDMNTGVNWVWQTGNPLSLIDDGSSTLGLSPGSLGYSNNPLDPGGYGNSTFDRGLEGNHGTSPNTSNVDLHVDLVFHIGKTKLLPAVDVFNVFNSRTATSIYQYATKQSTGEPDVRYGAAQEWLAGRRLQFGVKLQF
jgi:hypothetical protein